jgi:hypothetical protein
VLFIAGPGRSGSTLIAELLGQLGAFESVGELNVLWNRGLLENQPCGCRALFRECAYWRKVIEPHFGASAAEIETICRLRDGFFTLRFLRRLARGDRSGIRHDAREYARILGAVYRRIGEATGCAVVVDSSKEPMLGYVIGLIPDVDLHVLHVVRDPRAVAFSWRRRKLSTPAGIDTRYMPRFATRRTAVVWSITNVLCEVLQRLHGWRYMRLRYEDFVLDPEKRLADIRDFVGEQGEIGFFVDRNTARLDRITHQVWGNPMRFDSRTLAVRPDTEWTSGLPVRDRILVTALTLPMLLRYRYSWM